MKNFKVTVRETYTIVLNSEGETVEEIISDIEGLDRQLVHTVNTTRTLESAKVLSYVETIPSDEVVVSE